MVYIFNITTSNSACVLYFCLDGSLVKFSTAPEVADEECYRLLLKYMPDYNKENKITQKLFIQ